MFAAAKDLMLSQAAKAYLNGQFSHYGKVQELKIDSRAQRADVTCLLEGETSPVSISVGRFTVHDQGAKKFIEARDCTCTRLWMHRLIKDHVEGRRFEIPAAAARML